MGITSEEGNGMKIQRGVPVTSREWGFFVNCVVDTQVLIVHHFLKSLHVFWGHLGGSVS